MELTREEEYRVKNAVLIEKIRIFSTKYKLSAEKLYNILQDFLGFDRLGKLENKIEELKEYQILTENEIDSLEKICKKINSKYRLLEKVKEFSRKEELTDAELCDILERGFGYKAPAILQTRIDSMKEHELLTKEEIASLERICNRLRFYVRRRQYISGNEELINKMKRFSMQEKLPTDKLCDILENEFGYFPVVFLSRINTMREYQVITEEEALSLERIYDKIKNQEKIKNDNVDFTEALKEFITKEKLSVKELRTFLCSSVFHDIQQFKRKIEDAKKKNLLLDQEIDALERIYDKIYLNNRDNYKLRFADLIEKLRVFSTKENLPKEKLHEILRDDFGYIPSDLEKRIEKLREYQCLSDEELVALEHIHTKVKSITFLSQKNKDGAPLFLRYYDGDYYKCATVIEEFIESGKTRDEFISAGVDRRELAIAEKYAEIAFPEWYKGYEKYLKDQEAMIKKIVRSTYIQMNKGIKDGIKMNNGEIRDFDLLDFYLMTNCSVSLTTYCNYLKKEDVIREDFMTWTKFFNRYMSISNMSTKEISTYLDGYTEIECQKDNNGFPKIGTGREVLEADKLQILYFLAYNKIPVAKQTISDATKRYFSCGLGLETLQYEKQFIK